MSEPNETTTRPGEQQPRETLSDPVSRVTALAQGGMATTTELVTTDGIVQVTDLTPGDEVYALDPATKRVKCKPVTAIQTVAAENSLVEIDTRRAQLLVSPNQPIPYCTKKIDRVRFTSAGNLETRSAYRFINEWHRLDAPRLETVDLTDLLDEYQICAATDMHGHTFRAALPNGCEPCYRSRCAGYCFESETFEEHRQAIESIAEETWIRAGKNHHRFPYQFDADDFIRLVGWFVTEGSIYREEDRQTAEIQIAQEDDRYRESIRNLFERLGIDVTVGDRCFKFGSYLFGELLESLCGHGSYEKQLPSFVWSLPREQQELLLDVLLAGDGNDYQTYYTVSDQLKNDVCRLCMELGRKPRYTKPRNSWQIYVRETNDGFRPEKHVSRRPPATLYRLTVEDYPVVMAGQDGKFQWVGVSGLS